MVLPLPVVRLEQKLYPLVVADSFMAIANAPPSTTLVPARPEGTPITTIVAARPEGTPAVGAPADGNSTTEDPTIGIPTGAPASEGFSPVALDAALNGGLTPAKAPTFDNTLGLDIE